MPSEEAARPPAERFQMIITIDPVNDTEEQVIAVMRAARAAQPKPAEKQKARSRGPAPVTEEEKGKLLSLRAIRADQQLAKVSGEEP